MSRANRERRLENSRRKEALTPFGRPSFVDAYHGDLVEITPTQAMTDHFVNRTNSYLRVYMLGDCSVIVTREYDRWHMSISHPSRDPTWNEIAQARYEIMPDAIVAAMILPPRDQYINVNKRCYQVFEIRDELLTEGTGESPLE